jgi:hypothetical protein
MKQQEVITGYLAKSNSRTKANIVNNTTSVKARKWGALLEV